jgi:hypothetical protein
MTRPEQVFVGCPFTRSLRKNYDRLKAELEAETPLRVVLADTTSISSTDGLLEHITELIRESAGCVFDVTGGNPNVSLEVGIAHAVPVDFLLALGTRKPPTRAEKKRAAGRASLDRLRPIIADLQGRNRIEYKTYKGLKDQLLKRYLGHLPYMKRWHEFEKNHRSYAPFALKLFQDMRASGRSAPRRLDAIVAGSGISPTALTRALTHYRLITVRRGREGGYFYPSRAT